MTDLVKRLRYWDDVDLLIEAADRIEELERQNKELQADANRYCGLRAMAYESYPSCEGSTMKDAYLTITGYGWDLTDDQKDAAVDAALTSQTGVSK